MLASRLQRLLRINLNLETGCRALCAPESHLLPVFAPRELKLSQLGEDAPQPVVQIEPRPTVLWLAGQHARILHVAATKRLLQLEGVRGVGAQASTLSLLAPNPRHLPRRRIAWHSKLVARGRLHPPVLHAL